MTSRSRTWLWALGLALLPRAADAGDLNVGTWLERPGVRLVAVEFYATWCKPCMEAVPRWKALHDKYRAQGFRLIVVATQDPDGGCTNPGWNPDEVICDDEGTIAAAFGTADRLPSAYLWSWRGKLLVQKGHVDAVEAAVGQWAAQSPRLAVEVSNVDAAAGIDPSGLRDVVRGKLQDYDKVDVVATEAERKRFAELKRQGFDVRYKDGSRCKVGEELPPNSLLKVRVAGASGRLRLYLQMFDIQSGCLAASSIVDWTGRRSNVATSEGVAELFQKLRGPTERPRASKSEVRFSAGVQINVPRIRVRRGSTGLQEINLKVERMLEAAEDVTEQPGAGPEKKAAAWCALSEVHERNAYREPAEQACKEWWGYANTLRDRQITLYRDFGTLSGYLALHRKTPPQKLEVVRAFLDSYGRMDDARVKDAKRFEAELAAGRSPSAADLVRALQSECDGGEPGGCRLLGDIHERGGYPLTEASPSRARALYDKGCKVGFGPACTSLGALLEASADDAAEDAYRRACDANHFAGCVRLGDLAARQSNPRVAVKAYERACRHDAKDACSKAGAMQRKLGGAGDLNIEIVEKACRLGDPSLCLEAGAAYESGRGAKVDLRKSSEMYRRACDGDIAEACGRLGRREQSVPLLDKACKGGAHEFCGDAATLVAAEDPGRAAALHRRACDSSHAESCVAAAGFYDRGEGVDEDRRLASELLERACNLSVPDACRQTAERYSEGVGRPVNVAAAGQFYKLACRLGDDAACPLAVEIINRKTSMGGGRLAGLVLLGGAAVAGGLAGMFGGLGSAQEGTIRDGGFATVDDLDAAASTGRGYNTGAYAMIGVGVVAAVIGVPLAIFGGADTVDVDDLRRGR